MLAARLVYFVLPDQRVFRVKATALTKIFVVMDIVCFLVQAVGGSMMSNTEVSSDDPILRTGQQLYMSGCGLQLAFIVVFCGLMGRFYVKMQQAQRFDLDLKRVKALVWVMYVVLVLVIVSVVFCFSYDFPAFCSLNVRPPFRRQTFRVRRRLTRRDERTELTLPGDPDHLSTG